jgi:cysteine desulfurase/selenocysteine lyase
MITGCWNGMDVNRIRADFPLYSSPDRDLVYLDSACQSLRPRQVIEAMNEYYLEYPACAGRSVHRLGTKVSVMVEEAREKIAKFIGCSDPSCIVFTKNTTESLNMVAKGFRLPRGAAVLTTDMEHNSNHVPWLQMKQKGHLVHRIVPTPASGLFDLEAFKVALTPDVKMVSVVHSNNLTGTPLPAGELIEIAHDRGAVVMLDGAQSAPHQPIDVESLDVDLFAFSAHKMLGPSGVGVLYGKMDMLERIEPLSSGGGSVGTASYEQADFLPPPEGLEGGLLNYSGVIGTGAAADYLRTIGMDEVLEHERRLNRMATKVLKDIEAVTILGPPDATLREGMLSFNIRGMTSHDVAMIIDEMAKVLIRSGMHCMHPFFRSRGIDGCARASFYVYNTEEECARFTDAVRLVVKTFSS